MKKFFWLIVCLMTMVVSVNAQESNNNEEKTIFCLLVGHEKFMSKTINVTIDVGQKVGFWEIDTSVMKLVDENGEKLKFNSMVDACNYLSSLGWEYVNAYAASSNQGTCYHWLFKKVVKSGEGSGLKTAQDFKKKKPRTGDDVYQ